MSRHKIGHGLIRKSLTIRTKTKTKRKEESSPVQFVPRVERIAAASRRTPKATFEQHCQCICTT